MSSEHYIKQREERLAENRLKLERREAIRPLREMLEDTAFGIHLPPWVGTRKVAVTFDSQSRAIAWEDCSNREIVAGLQRDMLGDAEDWIASTWEDVVAP